MGMSITVRPYTASDLPAITAIWNEIVNEGTSFPQDVPLDSVSAAEFFAMQSRTAVAEEDGKILGLYILHPNNVGRCGHIANASYAVAGNTRGKGVGEHLVRDSLAAGKELGFRILQFNAVVKTNERAVRLYTKLGFTPLGVIPGGFYMKDGHFEDIIPFYKELV